MALGRVRHNAAKIDRAIARARRDRLGKAGVHTLNVRVSVARLANPYNERPATRYQAVACVKPGGRRGRHGAARCQYGRGRSVQSAVAKALVALGRATARRGRKSR